MIEEFKDIIPDSLMFCKLLNTLTKCVYGGMLFVKRDRGLTVREI